MFFYDIIYLMIYMNIDIFKLDKGSGEIEVLNVKIDDLDKLEPDGCNPIGIEDRKDKDGKIIIGVEQLKGQFENWKGPKGN